MAGETDLKKLLAGLRPRLHEEEYVVCTIAGGRLGALADLEPFATVLEEEGLTLVLQRERAEEAKLDYEGVFARITLQVHSSLEAVGLTAAVAGRLADLGISANVVAAYHHDHVLVPWDRREGAMEALTTLGLEKHS